jgi:hypothetical protein
MVLEIRNQRQILLIISLIISFLLLSFGSMRAQPMRFRGPYPLATPAENIIELKAEYEHNLKAINGGLRMIEKPNTPSKKEDKEAVTKAEFKAQVETMFAYATELATKLAAIQKEPWSSKLTALQQLGKSIKGGKNQAAIDWLTANEVVDNEANEELFLIWYDYLDDRKAAVPWLLPANIEITRSYRDLLDYVTKNFDRPYGLQAEQGAVSANAAQALSNCLEFPEQVGWTGGKDISLKKDDELRQLASNLVFYEWRLYTPINGQRAAAINRVEVRNIRMAIYNTVTAIHKYQKNWSKEQGHSSQILQLYRDAKAEGWTVDGLRAVRQGSDKVATDFYQAHTGRKVF